MIFEEIITGFAENHMTLTNTFYRQNAELVTVRSMWYIYLPLDFDGLRYTAS